MSIPIGVSTASLYPMYTEDALAYLVENHVACVEVFFNSPSELERPFLKRLKTCLDCGNTEVVSVHPFSSELENLLFFTDYPRRLDDGFAYYQPFFDACAYLGGKYLVLHGQNQQNTLCQEQTFAQFAALAQEAAKFGVTLLQENVARCKSGDPAYIRQMREALGDLAKFTLDVKQALRAGVSVEEMVSAMGPQIMHLHASDHTKQEDCLAPGKGTFDFAWLLNVLKGEQYRGAIIVELYRQNYKKEEELLLSCQYLQEVKDKFFVDKNRQY